MMSLPFNKVAMLTDLHFGRNQNNPMCNDDILDFLDWFIDKTKIWGADRVVMLGDWHHHRSSLALNTLDSSLKGMEKLSAAFEHIDFITGNHDLMYRDKRDIASTVFAKNVPNINFINDPLTIGEGKEGITFLPWLVGDEKSLAKKIKSRYVFSHLELPGYMLNSRVPMPHHDKSIVAEDFLNPEYVFSGHFHQRQHRPNTNVIYTGNIFPFDFSDDWEADRGCTFLEWGKEPEFHAWPDQPLFRTMNLSDLVSDPNKFLRPKLTARVAMDVDINFEEASFLKDELTKIHQLRRFELIPAKKANVDNEEATLALGTVAFQTVDQIVFDGLSKLDLEGYKSETLREIYISCSEGTLK